MSSPRRRFAQHFLAPAWADKVVRAIRPGRDERFLEIGPGPGALTLRLAPRVEHLTAIEIDRDLAAALQPQLPAHAEIVVGDFLDIDLAPYLAAGPLRVAGNLPYNISSPILFKLLALAGSRRPGLHQGGDPALQQREEPGPQQGGEPRVKAGGEPGLRASEGTGGLIDATVMLQLEVADRLVAVPSTKDYGVLTIFTALQANVTRLLTLPPGAFRPAPRVHSAVVRLSFKPSPLPAGAERSFESMVRTMFMQRRKTLLNALRSYATSIGADAGGLLTTAGIDPTRRPETLTQPELLRLVAVSAAKPKA